MSLRDQIQSDMTAAMKARNQQRVDTLRLAISSIKKKEIDETRRPLDDGETRSVLTTMIKQRRESIEMYKKGNRQDLLDKEQAEITVLEGYLPKQLDDAALGAMIDAAIQETNAAGMKDMGKVMKAVQAKVAGAAEGARVSALVKEKLSK